MDKLQAENEKRLLNHEKDSFKQLKSSYTNALADIKARVKILQSSIEDLTEIDTSGFTKEQLEIHKSQIQSKIYQLEYQKTLGKQVGAIVDVLKQDTIQNVQGYLDKMYQDSYLSMQYYINQQGIPVTTPINPSEVVNVVNKEIENMTYADRINANMNDFKKTIKAEISRGLASGSSYKEIAQMLSMVTGEDMYKSQRIVRTEGARVSSEAKLTSIRDMKEKGADLVKVWDSTLDGKTRETHAKLDQKWVEVDEPFKIDGYEVMAPGLFGDPSQDCNCRCVLLSVPRWDIDSSVVKINNETEELIETKNYDDWKKGYYRKITEEETTNQTNTINITNLDDCKNLMETVDFVFDTSSLKDLDFDLVKENTQQLHDLVEKYPFVNNHKRQDFVLDAKPQNSLAYTNGFGIHLNNDYYKNYDELVKKELSMMEKGWSSPFKEEYASVSTLTHEYGHLICNELVKQYYEDNPDIYQKSLKSISASNKTREKVVSGFIKEIKEIALNENPNTVLKISEYGRTDGEEMFAEVFMKSQLGKSDDFGNAMLKWLEGKRK